MAKTQWPLSVHAVKREMKTNEAKMFCLFSEISAGIVGQLQISNYRHAVLHGLQF